MLKWLRGAGNARERKLRRVAVIDATTVDRRRRLVLIRRDNIEHLLMIGGPTDLVIEPNIVRVGAREPALPAAREPTRFATETFNRHTPSEVPPPPRREAPRVSTPTHFHNLEELTRQLETALHRSPARQIHPPVTDPLVVPPPVSARSVAQPDEPILEHSNPRLEAKAEPMTDPKSDPKIEPSSS